MSFLYANLHIQISTVYRYAVVRVDPKIREEIIKNRRKNFIDTTSYYVKDQIHVTQCFACQRYGHKKGSAYCTFYKTNKYICLYCARTDHESKQYRVKHDVSRHKCANCQKTQKYGHVANHASTSPTCHIFTKEAETIIRRTICDTKLSDSKGNPTSKKIKTKLKMASFNSCSVRNKVVAVLTYVKDNDIDVCMLQETWLNKGDSSIIQEIKDHGYNIHSQRRLKGDIGGGVAILFNPNIVVRRCESRLRFKSFEFISCTIHTTDKTFRIINIYRLPYSKRHPVTHKMFFDEFSELMESQVALPGELIVTGDFNFRIEKSDSKKDAHDFVQLVDSFNLR